VAATARGDRAAAYDAFMGAVCGPDRLPDARGATVDGASHVMPLTHTAELADLVTGRVTATA
jgi:hypothetical protein